MINSNINLIDVARKSRRRRAEEFIDLGMRRTLLDATNL